MSLRVLIFATIFCLAFSQAQLPTLLQLTNYQFDNTYGCGSFESGSLFLSSYSLSVNSPELVLEAYCGSTPYAYAATAGNDLGFISDIGNVDLQNLTCNMAVQMTQGYSSTLSERFYIQAGHTYLVSNSFADIRAYWGFTVENIENTPVGNQVQIVYTIYLYEIVTAQQSSPGFNWTAYPGQNYH